MKNQVLKNGITQEQSDKARKIIKEASFKKVAEKLDISRFKIHNLLRGVSPDVELLQKAIETANEIISEKKKIIENLPV